MSGNTAELRGLLAQLTSYVADPPVTALQLPVPTPAEAMATYTLAARLVETDLRHPPTDVTMHREVLTATQRMLEAALAAHPDVPIRPALRLVEN